MRNVFALLLIAGAAVSCGKVKDPTPKGTALFDWDRSTAKGYDPKDMDGGPKHPLADAKILEGPNTHSFTVTLEGFDGKTGFSFDMDVDAAKVSWPEGEKDTTRWATTKITGKITQNDAFHLTSKCDDHVAYVMGAIGEVTNTMMNCRVVGKRPNTLGDKDAITEMAWVQIEGSGKLLSNDPKLKIVEH